MLTRTPVPTDTPAGPDHSLLAPAVAAAAAASVGTLLRAVATNRSSAVTRDGPSIEDVVRAELRPMLKDWLDAHLPSLVERLVPLHRGFDRLLAAVRRQKSVLLQSLDVLAQHDQPVKISVQR